MANAISQFRGFSLKERLQAAAAREVLGIQDVDDLPNLAASALVGGFDSPSMRELAGLGMNDHPGDKHRLFAEALSELGISFPTQIQAREQIVWFFSMQALLGEKSYLDVSRWVYWNAFPAPGQANDFDSKIIRESVVGLYTLFVAWGGNEPEYNPQGYERALDGFKARAERLIDANPFA